MTDFTFPPSNFNLIPNPFRPTKEIPKHEQLLEQVQELFFANRYRSAMDKLLAFLTDHPSNQTALRLAMLIAGTGRTAQTQAEESLPLNYFRDRRLDPIFAVCSACGRSTWAPHGCVTAFDRGSSARQQVNNPVGYQCYSCGYVVCKNCMPTQIANMELSFHSPICPNCAEPHLKPTVFPTGRKPCQISSHDGTLRAILIFRQGPLSLHTDTIQQLIDTHCASDMPKQYHIKTFPVELWGEDIRTVIDFAVAQVHQTNPELGVPREDSFVWVKDVAGSEVMMVALYADDELASHDAKGYSESQDEPGGVILWFHWQAISDAGHPRYGRYVYETVLPFFSPHRDRVIRHGGALFYDGDCRIVDGRLLIRNQTPSESRIIDYVSQQGADACYLLGIYATSGGIDFDAIDARLNNSATLGYLGIASYSKMPPEAFHHVTGTMSLCKACLIDSNHNFGAYNFGFLSSDSLTQLGFHVLV